MTRRIFCKVLLVVVAVFGLLVLSGVLLAQGNRDWAFEHVKDVQERNTDRLMAMNGVEGTAIGYNQNERLAIKVFTAGPGVRGIPKEIDGVPVQVVVTGKFYALSTTDRLDRPVPIGVSTGNVESNSAGTIGCRVTDGTDVYALSNNHVYALENTASPNSEVLQPGRYDGGATPDDVIGTLFAFEPIVFSTEASNTIDAAIALSDTGLLGTATPAGGYGTPSSTIVGAFLGQQVQKFGRTTELTKGEVTGVNATVDVGYSSGTARFVDQIIVQSRKPFIKAGDSGSLLVTDDADPNPLGLLFAGNVNGKLAVANRIDLVLARFGVTVDDAAGVSEATGSITGTVTDAETGNTISGATVTADPGGYSTTTAGDGTYTLADLPVGSYTLTASATGYTDESKTDDVLEGQTTTVDFALNPVAEPTTGSIEGTVTNVSDGTIEGATVSVDTGQSATTAADGTYNITGVPTGDRSVTASADGFESETKTATVYENLPTTVNFALNPVTTVGNVFVILPSITDGYATEGGRDGKKHLLITVALVDDLDNPVAGASVSIDLFLGGSPHTSGTGTTGTDGTVTFKVANAPSGTYTTEVTNVTTAELTWDGITPENSFTK